VVPSSVTPALANAKNGRMPKATGGCVGGDRPAAQRKRIAPVERGVDERRHSIPPAAAIAGSAICESRESSPSCTSRLSSSRPRESWPRPAPPRRRRQAGFHPPTAAPGTAARQAASCVCALRHWGHLHDRKNGVSMPPQQSASSLYGGA
jgi:hypothetical protein